MSFLESIFYMIWRGIAIGVLISAPMGPVGILCIQRTLDKGRHAGLYTGIGAAISDLIYCLITGFGLSFIEEFLERNSSIIQLAGSLVLIIFSLYLFRRNPAGKLKKPVDNAVSAKKSILGGFLFTFSNPLILFLIIGLFARFNFLMPDIRAHHYVIGFASILAGALGWWWLVTFFIDKVRAHFNLRSMWLINRIIGGVLLIFAVVGIITAVTDLASGNHASARRLHVNSRRSYSSLSGADAKGIIARRASMAHPEPEADFTLQFRMDASSANGKNAPWQLLLTDAGHGDSLAIDFSTEERSDGVSSEEGLSVSARLSGQQHNNAAPLDVGFLPYGTNLSYGINAYRLTRRGDDWQLSVGNRKATGALSFSAPLANADSIIFQAPAHGELRLQSLDITTSGTPRSLDVTTYDDSTLRRRLAASSDLLEGVWLLLDRTLNEDLLRMGGDYRLAIVRSADFRSGDSDALQTRQPAYDIVYLGGAEVNAGQWHRGHLKGRLLPSGIEGVWNVVWYDARGGLLSHDIKAQLESVSTLVIHFPYHDSRLRLEKTAGSISNY